MNRTAIVRRVSGGATAALVVLAGTALAFPLAATASSDVAHGQQPSATTAVVRSAHFSPDTPGVDVYLTAYSGGSSKLWLSDLGYGDVSSYRRIKPGLYVVSMRTHGAAAASPAGLRWLLKAKPGAAYTVAAVGMNRQLKGVVLGDRLSAPPAGHGLVRVIQAASRTPQAKLVAHPDVVVARDAKFGTSTGYSAVPAGRWVVQASGISKSSSTSLTTSKAINVQAGNVDSIIVLDAKGKGIELRAVHDAASSAVTPEGSIDAGGGGTAPRPAVGTSHTSWVFGAETAAALGILALLFGRRRTG